MTDPGTLVLVTTAALGAALSAAGDLAYLRDVRAGRTVPHRGAWLVWTVIGVVATVSHGASGGRWSLFVLSAQTLGCLLVLGYAIRRGVGGLTPANLALLALAGVGIVGWLALSNPVAACCGAVLADAAGLAGVVPKIWHQPHSETHATYALAGASGLLCALTAGSTDPAVLIYPLYFFAANALVARLITVRRRCAPAPGVPSRQPEHRELHRAPATHLPPAPGGATAPSAVFDSDQRSIQVQLR